MAAAQPAESASCTIAQSMHAGDLRPGQGVQVVYVKYCLSDIACPAFSRKPRPRKSLDLQNLKSGLALQETLQ